MTRNDFHNTDELKKHIITRGCYSREENERIYERWFVGSPRYLFRTVDKKYEITRNALCDVGCSYGMNLLHCPDGSYGIDIDKENVDFARSLGLSVYNRDIIEDDLTDLPKVDTLWCSAVLEHVDSPHIFLRKLHQLLNPAGLLALYVSTIPLLPALRRLPFLGRFVGGYESEDHVNAFVPATLPFFCERAGFETIEVSPFLPGPLSLLNSVTLANRLVGRCVYIGTRVDNWDYPRGATRSAVPNDHGYASRYLDNAKLIQEGV